MSDQGQPIDPSRMIGGRRAMTQSRRKEKERQNAKRGRGRRGDGSETSQATPPEESQVADLSQVEYLNYQDQVHRLY